MAAIRGKNTKAEVRLRKQLFAQGFRYRLHRRDLPGSPDIVLPKYRAVIFVHGCFWHRHGCRFTTNPATNSDFWSVKFSKNLVRDRLVRAELLAEGWRVATVWECIIGTSGLSSRELTKLRKWLQETATRRPEIQLPQKLPMI